MAKHYDVAVLGMGPGALAAAALLARRSWRVVVLGHGHRPPTYTHAGFTLARRSFSFLAASSPAWLRILVELAQSQTFRRRLSPLDPMLQVLGPDLRLDFPPDPVAFGKEIDREFPAVRRVVDDLYTELARTNAAADVAFDKDAVWPPGSFWERRESARILAGVPHLDDPSRGAAPRTDGAFLAELPRDHAYRAIVDLPARYGSHACVLPPFATARLHGAWTRGVQRLARGEDELTEFLLERVRAHGGETRLADRVAAITHRGGRVNGVLVDGDDAPTGVQFVVSDLPMRSLMDLATGYVASRRAMASLPRLAAGEHRFVVSLVVRDEGIPSLLGAEAFLIPNPSPSASADPSRPPLHLQRAPSGASGTTLLVAEALLPPGGYPKPTHAREAVLRTVEQFLPFIERHYIVVDSVHDGRPLWDYRGGARREVDRAQLRAAGVSIDAEPMAARWNVDPVSLHGLGGEPLRAPLGGAYLAGRTALPALGQEGELLAAWGAARLITRTDRRKEKMRREMWSKVELG
ncbi:MAG TPA: phytoene dehydrogenase [Polyangiaceae bacterium]|jgi:phytoene dehydrogenase-like protein